MRELVQPVNRGLDLGGGKSLPRGFLLRARNSRYLPKSKDRLWALLGRALFNSTAIPDSDSGPDTATCKAAFPFYVEGGTPKLCVHKGGGIYEANLAGSGSFSLALDFASSATERGVPAAYKDQILYPVGANGWSPTVRALLRTTSAWREAGHLTPTDTFTAATQGSGSFGSTTDIKYTYRIYDSTTDTESAHGPVVTKTSFSGASAIRLTWASGITNLADLGTHVRIYRTALDETAGVYWRVDGSGDGIAIGSFIAGYTHDDSTDNTTAKLYGTVRADGTEGEIAWAEHGGPVPQCGGMIEYRDHIVCYDCYGEENLAIYSAQGYPEAYPVDWDGDYQYYLELSSSRQDVILAAAIAGEYLLFFMRSAIFRISHLPTYANPGFDRRVQEELTREHGVCGKYALTSFGIGSDRSQLVLFVDSALGPMVTDGIRSLPLIQQVDWENLVEPAYIENIEVKDYPFRQEVWIAYTPKGGTANTEALIVDYSQIHDPYGGRYRVTGPVDAKIDALAYGQGSDNEKRFYILESATKKVYVQDSGSTDAQQNTNANGDILVDWETGGRYLAGRTKNALVHDAYLEAGAGSAGTWSVEHRATDGDEEHIIYDSVSIGGNDGEDVAADVHLTGARHRTRLYKQGATGSSYDESETTCAPWIKAVAYDVDSAGQIKRTSGDGTAPT